MPQATAERPLVLALFDLDGFKQYNDTFGHPAGDTLLVRLGGNLAAFLHGRGRAFRMGGDEFCAVFQTAGEPFERDRARRRRRALRAGRRLRDHLLARRDHAPARDPRAVEALRIADQRMYANKHAGRTSAGRQSKDVLLRALAERDPGLGTHAETVRSPSPPPGARAGGRRGRAGPPRERAARRRQGRDPGRHPRQAGPADRGGVGLRPPPPDHRRAHHPRGARARARRPRSCAPATSAGTAPATPTRLAGDAIPLGARIVAVADAYAAMTAGRPYRAARTPEQALAELRARAGHPVRPRRGRSLVRRAARRRGMPRRPPRARPAAARVRRRMAAGAETLKRTPLYDRHVAAGASLVPFAGWEMPVQYAGIREEHVAVRERAGVFDVSHMGEVETTGPGAEAFLQRVLSNDVTQDRRRRRAVLGAVPRERRRARRPLHVPPRRRRS